MLVIEADDLPPIVLERTGLADDTLVVFASDHGEMMGERGMWFKQCFFERAARVPLLMAGAGVKPAGQVDSGVSLVDLMPTLLDFAGRSSGHATPTGASLLLKAFGFLERSVFSTQEFSSQGRQPFSLNFDELSAQITLFRHAIFQLFGLSKSGNALARSTSIGWHLGRLAVHVH